MNEEDDLFISDRGHWRVLPGWAKAITVLVGVPAWLVLLLGVFTNRADDRTAFVAFCVFGSVGVLQTVLIFRAYWRMEL